MILEPNTYTSHSFLEFLKKEYTAKITGKQFNMSDIAQYLLRGQVPYRYGGHKISSKKENGIRIITIEK